MPAPSTAPAPIYDRLVDEQGDVLADAREAAHKAERTAEGVLDFGHGGAAQRQQQPAQGPASLQAPEPAQEQQGQQAAQAPAAPQQPQQPQGDPFSQTGPQESPFTQTGPQETQGQQFPQGGAQDSPFSPGAAQESSPFSPAGPQENQDRPFQGNGPQQNGPQETQAFPQVQQHQAPTQEG